MNIGRSTIEKHIRVLVEGEILEKNPGLSSEGQLRVYYNLLVNTRKLLEIARNQEIFEEWLFSFLDSLVQDM